MAADLRDVHCPSQSSGIQVQSAVKHSHHLQPHHVPVHHRPLLTYHPHYLPSGKLNPAAADFEVNGNYAENPELKMPEHHCWCDAGRDLSFEDHVGLDPEAFERESGLPYVVADGALHSLISCHKCHSARVPFQIGESGRDVHSQYGCVQMLHESHGESCDSGSERIHKEQDGIVLPYALQEPGVSDIGVEVGKTYDGENIEDGSSESYLSHVSSCEDESDSTDMYYAQATADILTSSSSSSVSSLSALSSMNFIQHLPLISETSIEEDHAATDAAEELSSLATETDYELDQSQNASFERRDEAGQAVTGEHSSEEQSVRRADSHSACLPLPFRFLRSSTPRSPASNSRNLSDKLPMGSSSSHRGKSRPPPRQSWLLRLFESKMFDMNIAITYLYNSKEPGVQTYIGK